MYSWTPIKCCRTISSRESPIAWVLTRALSLVWPATMVFVAAAVLAGAIRLTLVFASTRMSMGVGADLGAEVYRRTLYQPYQTHATRNSSDVISVITGKISGVVSEVMIPVLTLVSSALVTVAISITLILIDPLVAVLAVATFGAAYLTISKVSQLRLQRNSVHISREQTRVVKAIQEGLGGIRDVLLDGSQPVYTRVFREADSPLRRAQGNVMIIGRAPRFLMEVIGMVAVAMLAYYLAQRSDGIGASLPLLGALALGAQRLLPSLQLAYQSWASMTGYTQSLADVVALLEQPLPPDPIDDSGAPLAFDRGVVLDNVRFRYQPTGPWVLDGLDLTVPKGTRCGLMGTTGAGKSTVVDLIMGLLSPTEGIIAIDGEPLTGRRLPSLAAGNCACPSARVPRGCVDR